MINTKVGHFPPAKQFGMILHGVIIVALAGASIWGFANLTNAQVGPAFVSYLLTGLLAFAPIPFLGYRAYALFKADYYIDRDSLAILWGLRLEDIPLTDIEWVRPATDLTHPLSLPRFRLPGAVLGTRRHPDLGAVEFIASSARNLILIATSKHVFAISPRDAASLVRTFARATEMGSLTPAEPKSVYPSFVITQAWESPFDSVATHQRANVPHRTIRRVIFISLGKGTSACIYHLAFKHTLRVIIPHGSSVPRYHTSLNANSIRLHSRHHGCIYRISRSQLGQKRSIC